MNRIITVIAIVIFANQLLAQNTLNTKALTRFNYFGANPFQTDCIIENKGQFSRMQHHALDVQFAVQNKGEDYFFTKKGYSTKLQSKELRKGYQVRTKKEKAMERELGLNLFQQKESKKYEVKTDWLDMEWIGANNDVLIIPENKTKHYFTYGLGDYNSYGYQTITYKNLYNGIDVVYEVHPKGGIEYTLHVKPGADLSKVKYRYVGADAKVEKGLNSLTVKNNIKPLFEKDIYAYYKNKRSKQVVIDYKVKGNEVSFVTNGSLDPTQELIIDPWVTAITTLLGSFSANNTGCDVDYDLAGNLYVLGAGGGVGFEPKVAKFDPLGNLLWTFSGVLITPSWSSYGSITDYIGNFIVHKQSGKVYIGQGWTPSGGATVIRLTTAGVYDNFISVANSVLEEVWEMQFNCNTGQLIAMGGSTSANTNFGLIDTTTGIVTVSNMTGFAGTNQDVVSGTLNSLGEVFLLFNSFTTGVDNFIFKWNSSYTASLWNVFSGYNNLSYVSNKSYAGLSSVGHNSLYVNSNYLFLYDGANLKAFDPATGVTIGTPVVIGTNSVIQGGIYANNCNEVFLGGPNGEILRYNFNGTNFIAQPSIIIAGQTGNSIHDLTLNPINNTLYVTGDNFVATVLPGTACLPPVSGAISLSASIDCPNIGIVNVTNATAGNSYTYIWQDSISGAILQTHQGAVGVFADTFSNMMQDSIYKVIVIQSAACQVVSNFIYVNGSCSDTSIYLCQGQTFTLSNGTILNTPGNYTDTFTNIFGLDSVITVTIYDGADTTIINQNLCPNATYVLPNGIATNIPGSTTYFFTNVHGCDSTVIVNLTATPNSNTFNTAFICSSATFTLPNGVVTNIPGVYTHIFVNANGCDSIVTTNLNIIPFPYSIVDDTVHCKPGSAIPLIASGGNSISWTSSNGALGCANCYNQIVNPTTNISYFAVLTDPNGCVVRDTVNVSIFPFNMFLNVNDLNICEGQPITFSSQIIGSSTSGTLNLGNGTIVNQLPLFQYTYNTPGTYIAYLLGKDTLGCSDSIAKVIKVYGRNNLNFNIVDTNVCIGEPVIIKDSISGNVDDFVYDFNDQTIFTNFNNPTHTYETSNTYVVTLTGSNAECPDSVLKRKVIVNNYPNVDLGPDTAYCPSLTGPISINNKGNGPGSSLWNNGATGPTIAATEAGLYWLTVSNNGCEASDTIMVERDCYLNIPNAFTPNASDKLNSHFFPRDLLSKGVVSFTMNIYNRWGNQVFTTNNINGVGWDGNYGNKPQPMGVYVYNISVAFKNGEFKNYTGNVTLIR